MFHLAVLNVLRMSMPINAQNLLRLPVPLLALVAMPTTAWMASTVAFPSESRTGFPRDRSHRPCDPVFFVGSFPLEAFPLYPIDKFLPLNLWSSALNIGHPPPSKHGRHLFRPYQCNSGTEGKPCTPWPRATRPHTSSRHLSCLEAHSRATHGHMPGN